MKYGNFATFDCPTNKIKEAFNWLDDELEKISDELDCSCYIVKILNPHDFGYYPSFEIFMPEEYECCYDEEDKKTIKEAERCLKKLNNLESRYYKKFNI